MSRLLSPEHRELRELARKFATEEVAPRRLEADEGPEFLKEINLRAGELGLPRTVAPEELGGRNLGQLGGVLVVEELARESGGVALSVMIQMTFPMIMALCPEAAGRWLEGALDGKTNLCAAFSDPVGIANYPEHPDIATRDGDEFVINCRRNYVTQGTFADVIGVAGVHDDNFWMFWVPADTPGVSVEPMRKMGVGAPWGGITLRDVRVPATLASDLSFVVKDREIANVDGGAAASVVNISAWSLGLATGVHEKTVEFVKTRSVRGRPLGSLQAIQHKLVRQRERIEAARSILYDAANARDHGEGDSVLDHLVKTFVTETAADVARDCVTIHGGRGYLKEGGIEIYLREAIGGLIAECPTDMHYSTAAHLMGLPGAEPGAF
jgi:alkylation response protein AidB-like acyl-CoA dehydrogenase